MAKTKKVATEKVPNKPIKVTEEAHALAKQHVKDYGGSLYHVASEALIKHVTQLNKDKEAFNKFQSGKK